MPQFLSEEWINAARDIRLKYADQAPPFPHKIKMNQVISEVPESVSSSGEVKIYMSASPCWNRNGFSRLATSDSSLRVRPWNRSTAPRASMAARRSAPGRLPPTNRPR